MYCQNCGNKVKDSAKFCSLCGAKLNSVEKSKEEKIEKKVESHSSIDEEKKALMVLNTSLKEGFLKSVVCYNVFFNDRIVFFKLSKDRQNEEVKKYQKELKESGAGFLKSSAAMISFLTSFGDRFYKMTPEEILAEDKESFQVFNNNISKIEFKQSLIMVENDGQSQKMGHMKIKYPSGELKFQHKYKDSNGNIKKVLSSLFNRSLKYKGRKTIVFSGNKDGFR
ncbi:MAG: zinc ribbon domain-containing protein [Eubacteriales bacterium]